MILVIGASGYIGNSIFKKFIQEKFDVLGTYNNKKKDDLIFFDLQKMSLEDIKFNKKISHIIIASGININIDDSKKDWENSYNTNVIKTKFLIDYCFENNIMPIYISSDGVFDGSKGGYSEIDNKNPINCYGRIKAEVEDYLVDSRNKFLILRMGRVFGTDLEDGTIITSTIKKLKKEKNLLCANDEFFSPLNINDLCDFLIKLIQNKCDGIFHLTSIKSTSRFEIAKAIEKYFDFRDVKITPCSINSIGLLEKRPLKINLDDNKFNSLIGVKHHDIKHYLEVISKKK